MKMEPDRLVPLVLQRTQNDCGIAIVMMMLAHFGMSANYDRLLELMDPGERGASRAEIAGQLAARGLVVSHRQIRFDGIASLPPTPWIAHMLDVRREQFVIVEQYVGDSLSIADPAWGRLTMSARQFSKSWSGYAMMVQRSKVGS